MKDYNELFNRCCEYLKQGDSRAVYVEILPVVHQYERTRTELPQEICALMASCAVLDALKAGDQLETVNLVEFIQHSNN
ncbi:MAG: hypothetical protein ACOY3I_10290 [Verrucomicrobiota bacterium]